MMQPDWHTCDGTGRHCDVEAAPSDAEPREESRGTTRALEPGVTRRGLLRRLLWTSALGGVSWAGGARALAGVAVSPQRRGEERPVLVTVFLRGGADGLNIVVPYGDDGYGRARPTIGIAAPRDLRSGDRALDLDGFFGLHPRLSPLMPFYREGKLAFAHALGSLDQTRSHFEAMSAMERGLPDDGPSSINASTTAGWLARYLDAGAEGRAPSPLRAVALGRVLPDSLRGAAGANVLRSLDEFRLRSGQDKGRSERLREALAELYDGGRDEVALSGRATLGALEALERADPARRAPSNGARYPESALGQSLRQVAILVRARVGLEVACLDTGGWDTHVAQGGAGGWMAMQLDDLGRALAAFATDLGRDMKHVTVVVMTEFGRRLNENSGLGTDHGRASMMMLLGGGVRGGRVVARWPGLAPEQLEAPGDLRVTLDYRDVLAEVVARGGEVDLSRIFPGYTSRPVGVIA